MMLEQIIKKYDLPEEAANDLRKLFNEVLQTKNTYLALLDSAKDLIYLKDRDFRFVFINRAGARYLNMSKEEIIGKKATELSDKKLAEVVEALDRRALNGEIVDITQKTDLFRKEPRWFHNIRVPVRDEKGDIIGIGVVVHDITDLKQTEAELRKQKEEIRMILDSIPALIFYKDLDDKLIKVNKYYSDMIGMDVDEIEGKHQEEIIPEKSRNIRYKEQDRQVIESRKPLRITEPYFLDEFRWFQSEKVPVFDNNNNIIGILGFIVDITERKKNEDTLRLQSKLLDSITESVMATDISGHIIFWNKGAEKLYGYTAEEVIGKLFTFIFDPDHIDEQMKRFEKAKTQGSVHEEYLQYCKDGSQFYSEKTISVITDSSGYTVGFMSIDRDVSDKVEYRENLKKSRQLYRNFVDQSYDGIFMTGTDSRITQWNKAMEKITGIPKEEAIGQYSWDVQHNLIKEELRSIETYNSLVKNSQKFLKTGEASYMKKYLNYEIIDKNGQIKLIQILHFPIKAENGYKAGSIVRDITRQKKTEEALKASEQLYRSLFENSGVAHIILNLEGKIIKANRFFVEICGFSIDELTKSLHWKDIIASGDIKLFDELIQHTEISDSGQNPVEIGIRSKSKGIAKTLAKITSIPSMDYTIATFIDISETVKLSEEIDSLQYRFDSARDAADEIFWDMDLEFNQLLFVTSNWLEALGYEKYEFPHTMQTLFMLTHPDDAEIIKMRFDTKVDKGKPFIYQEFRFRTKSGKYKWMLTRGKIKSLTPNGKVKRVAGNLIDITDYKRLQRKLELYEKHSNHCQLTLITDENFEIEDIYCTEDLTDIESLKGQKIHELLTKPKIDLLVIEQIEQEGKMEFDEVELKLKGIPELTKLTISKSKEIPSSYFFIFTGSELHTN